MLAIEALPPTHAALQANTRGIANITALSCAVSDGRRDAIEMAFYPRATGALSSDDPSL